MHPGCSAVPGFDALRPLDRERRLRALRDQAALLLDQRRVEMQHERVGVRAKLGHDERHALAIRPEMKATSRNRRSSFETITGHLAVRAASQRRRQLRPAIERVGALAGLRLDVFGDALELLGFGELGDGGALRLDPEPGGPGRSSSAAHADLRSAYVDQKLESDRAAAQVEKDALLVVQPNAEHATAAAHRDGLSPI
jgi:hypothetical protein